MREEDCRIRDCEQLVEKQKQVKVPRVNQTRTGRPWSDYNRFEFSSLKNIQNRVLSCPPQVLLKKTIVEANR